MADWTPYIVRQGDYLDGLAYRAGASPKDVWQHAKNKELTKKRDSGDQLAPGDVIYLPDNPKTPIQFSKTSSVQLTADIPRRDITVHFETAEGPVANQPYLVEPSPRGQDPKSPPQSGGDGKVTLSVTVIQREVTVHFTQLQKKYTLLIGAMDPVTERSGVQKRLENLAFLTPNLRASDATLARALRAFQRAVGIEPTGEADESTRKKLVAEAGL
ncbi:MAG: peptidoglycan-binding domain-containing protein [Polyangiaceae bacterium]